MQIGSINQYKDLETPFQELAYSPTVFIQIPGDQKNI